MKIRLNFLALMAAMLFMQPAGAQVQYSPAYADFHAHLTYKHYYREIDSPKKINGLTNAQIKQQYGSMNWSSYGETSRARRNGKESHLQNYDQVSYAQLRATSGSILCSSFYPYEKTILLSRANRRIDHRIVSRMSEARLLEVASDQNDAFQELMAEYRFAANQQEDSSGLTIHFARNNTDLRNYNQQVKTSYVMTIEGGHSFFGPYVSNSSRIRAWQCDSECENEIMGNISAARNLEHRLFFVTIAHFTWNRIAGNAKSLDKFGYRRSFAQALTYSVKRREKIFLKWGEGIHGDIDLGKWETLPAPPYKKPFLLNFTDNSQSLTIGRKAILALLEPKPGAKHPKPTYIDIKHMDIQARLEYYQIRDSLVKAWGINIPIIASHVAVSGEDELLARATGLYPLNDRYPEVRNPLRYYKKYSKKYDEQFRAITTYKHSNPKHTWYINDAGINPFEGHINENTANWFYPWSINLFNEEIFRIHSSDGIMGIMLDGRQLGADLPNYSFAYWRRTKSAFKKQNVPASQLTFTEYKEMEPFFRNIVYIAQHCNPSGSLCWEHISLGTDFDGLIDPLDVCPTAEDIPAFRSKAAIGLDIYCKLHNLRTALGNATAEEVINKVFYTNGQRFILNYF